MTATLVLSGTSSFGAPPSAVKARVWAPIQSASAWVQLAEARIAIPFGAALDVLVPQHRQGDVLAFQVAMNLSPVRLGMTAMTLLGAGRREQRRLQRAVGHLCRQWPVQPGS